MLAHERYHAKEREISWIEFTSQQNVKAHGLHYCTVQYSLCTAMWWGCVRRKSGSKYLLLTVNMGSKDIRTCSRAAGLRTEVLHATCHNQASLLVDLAINVHLQDDGQ